MKLKIADTMTAICPHCNKLMRAPSNQPPPNNCQHCGGDLTGGQQPQAGKGRS